MLFALMMFAAASGRAETLNRIKADHPNASAYAILQRLYETSTTPAQLNDFDMFGQSSLLKCAGAQHDRQLIANAWATIYRYKTILSGNPGHGPLFPGTPGSEKTIAIGEQNSQYREQFAAATTVTLTATELVNLTSRPSGLDDPNSVYPYGLLFRRNENYLAVKEWVAVGTDHESVNYGYCWREN